MEPPPFDRHRRLITILLLVFVYMISGLLQSVILNQIEATSTGIIRTAKKYGLRAERKVLLKDSPPPNFKGDIGDTGSPFATDLDDVELPFVTKVYVELKSCLPRFICEVHADGVKEGAGSDLEKDVLAMFRNYMFLEGPSSPVYSYQLAAHMGQLSAGLTPSPCHGMYPSCPLSRSQLLDLLAGVRTKGRAFA